VAEPVVVAELVEATTFVSLFCSHFDASTNSAITSLTTVSTSIKTIFSKKYLKIISSGYLMPKLVVEKYWADEN